LSRLLIVDDNEQLRTSLSRYLEQCGYSVFPARSAQAAIDAVEDDPEGFDILLTDIVMPGVSGIDLASGIRRRAPSISVVFMTGYTEAEVMSRGLLDADGAVFSKDMPVERLLGLLEGVGAAQESTAGDDPDASI
jgi:CheY-like chemotaxis protein